MTAVEPPEELVAPPRLEALEKTSLLDSPAEAVFDRAVKLATRVLGTPVGLFSLVDGDRQFFKAQTGLAEPYATRRETPLSHSFCQHVVIADDALVVRDARKDQKLRENLAIRDLGVVAYLGIPVHNEQGEVIGSFCAIDGEPRNWTDEEKELLEDIAVGVESEIALRAELRKRIEAEKKSARVEEQLNLAIHAARLGTFDFDPRTEVALWDQSMYDLWWIDPGEPDLFQVAQDRVHPEDRAGELALRRAALDPTGNGHHSAEFRILHPETGEIRWLHLDGDVTFDEGVPVRVTGIARDITDRQRIEHQKELLTKELNHRVKNLFTITSGMISLTARSSETPKEMAAALNGRIQALSQAHELIQPAIIGRPDLAASTTLEHLVRVVLGPYMPKPNEAQLRIQGPDIELKPKAASSLALVLHELATNAQKYGALSVAEGELDISWSVKNREDSPCALILEWQEAVEFGRSPTEERQGFGTTLIHMTVTGQLGGEWRKSSSSSGFSCSINIPVSSFEN